MGRPIDIQIDTKVKDAGLDKTADGLEKVSDALDDVASDAKTSGRDTERALDGISDAAKDTAKAGDKLDRDLTQALESVAKESKRAGDALGDNVRRGAREADEGLDTMSENAASNAKEIGASFDGTFEGLVDGIQGFVAEATEGFGAVGLIGGVAFAAAIGIGISALESAAEKANAITEEATAFGDAIASAASEADAVQVLRDRYAEVANKVGDARSIWEVWQSRARTQAEQFADAIRQGSLSASDLEQAFSNPNPVERLEELRRVAGQLETAISRASDANTDLGTSLNTRVGPAQQRVNREMLTNIEVSKAAKDILDDEIATQEASNAILEAKAVALGLTVEQYREQQSATEAATAAQDAYASAVEGTADPVSTYEGILQRKQEADRAAAEATAAATEDSADSWENYVTNVGVSVDDMIAEWNRQAEAQQRFNANLAVIAAQGGQAIADELRAKGPEVAGAAADALANAGDAKVREAAEAYGRASGTQAGQGIAAGIAGQQGAVQSSVDSVHKGIRVPALTMPVTVDLSGADRQVRDWMSVPRKIGVSVAANVQQPV